MPSRSGIVTSSTTTAGGRASSASSASRPPAAVETAKPSRRSARWRACLTDASSSTTRTSGSFLRSTPPMMRRLGRKRVLHLVDAYAELLGQRRGELVTALLVLGLLFLLDLVERGVHLRLVDAELVGQLRRQVVALVAGPGLRAAQLLESLLQVRLLDAQLLGHCGQVGTHRSAWRPAGPPGG